MTTPLTPQSPLSTCCKAVLDERTVRAYLVGDISIIWCPKCGESCFILFNTDSPKILENAQHVPQADYGAQWDVMSYEQKVEWLATKVMGWQRRKLSVGWTWASSREEGSFRFWESQLLVENESILLTDWNHWRQVEEKVFADANLVAKLNEQIGNYAADRWMRSDLPTRARALFIAYSSIYGAVS